MEWARFLEEELARKYKEAAPATLAILQQRCDDVTASLTSVGARLSAVSDVASLRKAGQLQSHSPVVDVSDLRLTI